LTGCNNHLLELHNYNYEVCIFCKITVKSPTVCTVRINSENIVYGDSYGTSTGQDSSTHCNILVDNTRQITFEISRQKTTSTELIMYRYRRIGSNS